MIRTFSRSLEMKGMNLPGFIELKTLGKGTYGSVYKARRESDGNSYAVKVVNLSSLNHREIEDSVNEIRLMASFNSPFIIRFYEAFCDNKRLCIVTEYSRLGDLAHLIERRKRKNKPLKEDVIWCYFLQLLEGLNSLHSVGVVHRDLKSANILISAPDLIKIADLGVSTVLRTRQLARTQIGTPLYLAPEVWKRRPYDHKCDMWSLGVLLYEMMTFTYPFMGRSTQDLAKRVCVGRYTIPQGKYSNDLISVVRRLLQVNPVLRPSVSELLDSQVVKSRMHMLNPFMQANDPEIAIDDKLLSTIKVPQNMRNMNFPNPSYGRKAEIVKPLEQRMHMKRGVPMRKELPMVSSPELQLIADLDWWSPNKLGMEVDEEALCMEPVQESTRPHSHRPVPVMPPAQPAHQMAPRAPRNPPAARKYNQFNNPRFRRIAIR